MLSTTLNDYKDSYQSNLDAFLIEYEDNTKLIFLQNELGKYQDYQDALTIIPKQLNYPTIEDIKNLSFPKNVASNLEKLCPKAYDDIVTTKLIKGDFEADNEEFLLPGAIPSLININHIKLQNYINSSKRILEFITDKIKTNSPNTVEKKKATVKNHKSEIWFQVGLLFAKGDMNKYYNPKKSGFKDGYSAPKVAREIGHENYDKFILATINNYHPDNTNANKNIYNFKDKMDKIIKHCNEHLITIDTYFLSRLPIE